MVNGLSLPGLVLSVFGLVFFLGGCVSLARAKGYPPVLGALLAFMFCGGILILIVLPDRYK
jgi:hypothetical protein